MEGLLQERRLAGFEQMKREWWYGLALLVAFVALGSYYLSNRIGPKEVRRTGAVLSPPPLRTDLSEDREKKFSGIRNADEAVHWGRNPFLTPE